MPIRIIGVTIPQDKRIVVALTYLYGIGTTSAKKILKNLKINPDTRVKDISTNDENKLREYNRDNYKLECD